MLSGQKWQGEPQSNLNKSSAQIWSLANSGPKFAEQLEFDWPVIHTYFNFDQLNQNPEFQIQYPYQS